MYSTSSWSFWKFIFICNLKFILSLNLNLLYLEFIFYFIFLLFHNSPVFILSLTLIIILHYLRNIWISFANFLLLLLTLFTFDHNFYINIFLFFLPFPMENYGFFFYLFIYFYFRNKYINSAWYIILFLLLFLSDVIY
jgi:hypothetical protein